MAIRKLAINLSAHQAKSRINDAEQFLCMLDTNLGAYSLRQAFQNAAVNIDAGAVRLSDFEGNATEPFEEFERTVQDLFTAFAAWLVTIPSANMDQLHLAGWSMQVVVNLDMDQDQMDVTLQPVLCAELARLKLPIYFISNE